MTPLLLSVGSKDDHFQKAILLIDKGANIYAKSDRGNNLIHVLAMTKCNEFLAYILDKFEFNLSEKTNKGHTAFDICK